MNHDRDTTGALGSLPEGEFDATLRELLPPELPSTTWLQILSDAAHIVASDGGEHLDALAAEPEQAVDEGGGTWRFPDGSDPVAPHRAEPSTWQDSEWPGANDDDPATPSPWDEPDTFDDGTL